MNSSGSRVIHRDTQIKDSAKVSRNHQQQCEEWRDQRQFQRRLAGMTAAQLANGAARNRASVLYATKESQTHSDLLRDYRGFYWGAKTTKQSTVIVYVTRA